MNKSGVNKLLYFALFLFITELYPLVILSALNIGIISILNPPEYLNFLYIFRLHYINDCYLRKL